MHVLAADQRDPAMAELEQMLSRRGHAARVVGQDPTGVNVLGQVALDHD